MVLAHQQIDFESLGKQQRAALENLCPNVGSALDARAESQPDRVGWMYPAENDQWQKVTWKEFRDFMHIVASGLLAQGIEPGDVVAISANTSIRWVLSDFAINAIAAVTCAIYPNTHISDVEFIVSDSGTSTLIVENTTLLERMLASADVNNALKHIILLNGENDEKYANDSRVVTWKQLIDDGKKFHSEQPNRVRELTDTTNHDSLASIIYTSGTTGRPKGVELTHGNWIYEGAAWGSNYTLRDDDVHFIWLPLTHVFGKSMLLVDIFCGTITALDGRVPKIVDNLGVLKPTLMCGVPRIFEKIKAGTQAIAKPGSPKAAIIAWANKVGRKSFPYRSMGEPMPKFLDAQYKLADKLVFSTIRKTLGGNLRQLVSGSARLDPELQRWFFNLGIKLVEGYGVTETCAVTTYNRPWEFKMGTVGKVAPGTQLKIAEDGEILVRGGGVMRCYHNDPELTQRMIQDGWFHTGDVGSIDDEGYVRITDRIKDVMKSSNGKFISPAAVESTLTSSSPAIAQAVVVGEGRKYVSALIALDEEWVQKWAALNGLKMSYAKLLKSPKLRETIQSEIDAANQNLSRWEQVKKFEFLPGEMSANDGTATPTAKVKRNIVINKYSDLIEKMYEGAQMWGPANPNYV